MSIFSLKAVLKMAVWLRECFAVAEGPLTNWIQGGDGQQGVFHVEMGWIRNGNVNLLELGVVDTFHGGQKFHLIPNPSLNRSK
jgi:hypothetical protein